MENEVGTSVISGLRLPQLIRRLTGALAQSKRGIEDVVVSMVPQGVSLATGLFSSVLVARGLGPAGLGEYALVLSTSDMAVTLSDLGIGQTAIRYATRAAALGDSEGHFGFLRWAFRRRMFVMAFISLGIFVAAPALATSVWHNSRLTHWLRLGLLIGAFGALAHVPSIYFQSLKRFQVNASVLTGQALISFLGILVLAILKHWSVNSVILVSVVTAGCGAMAFLVMVPKPALISGSVSSVSPGSFFRNLWRGPQAAASRYDQNELEHPDTFAHYMLLSSIVVVLITKADVWLMGYFLNSKSIGIYNAGMRFTVPLAALLSAMNTALWPRASGLIRIEDKLSLLRRTSYRCVPVALAGLVYGLAAPLLAPVLFGPRYTSSVMLGQLLCVRYVIAILTCPVGVVCYALGFVRIYWIINLVQLVAVVATNVMLLPRLGPAASAIALIVNDTLGFMAVGTLVWLKVARRTTNVSAP
jgi:O-antigen/teichoic acid export membrane protein